MKVLVVSPNYFSEDVLSEFDGIANVVSKDMSHEELVNEIGDYDVILTRVDTKFDRKILENAHKLKAIGTATTGLDHIDIEYAKNRNIKIFSLSSTHTIPTAEYTLSLLLSIMKKIPWSYESLSSGKWERHKFFGNTLEGKTIGIIGFGKIGSMIGKYAKSLGMDVITYDPYINKPLADEIGARVTSLDDVLENSDVITLHAFMSPENRNMINSDAFSKMKNTAFLINAARGELVNGDDLLDALSRNKIAGAALDVFTEEPLPSNSKLVEYSKNHDNLLITPHMAASTIESVNESAREIVKNVKEFLLQQGSNQIQP